LLGCARGAPEVVRPSGWPELRATRGGCTSFAGRRDGNLQDGSAGVGRNATVARILKGEPAFSANFSIPFARGLPAGSPGVFDQLQLWAVELADRAEEVELWNVASTGERISLE